MADDILSDEDKALFRACVRSVKPLKQNKISPKASERKKEPLTINKTKTVNKKEQLNYLSDQIIEPVNAEAVLSWGLKNLPTKRIQELKKGLIKPEARLDLHGCHVDEARHKLIQFIIQQNQKRIRCLLVVHGKGGVKGEVPILKNKVNRWLPQLKEVCAFHSALAKDGGTGAVYILLRKKKN